MRTYSNVGIPFAIAHVIVVVTKILYSALSVHCCVLNGPHFHPVIIFTSLVSNSTVVLLCIRNMCFY